MTILAWDGSNLAADKQASRGNFIEYHTKLVVVPDSVTHGDCIMGTTGPRDDSNIMMTWLRYDGHWRNYPNMKEEVGLMVVNQYGLWVYSAEPFPVWKGFEPFALGSLIANAVALECLYRGDDAGKAVLCASRYDDGCSGDADRLNFEGVFSDPYMRDEIPPRYEYRFPYPTPKTKKRKKK